MRKPTLSPRPFKSYSGANLIRILEGAILQNARFPRSEVEVQKEISDVKAEQRYRVALGKWKISNIALSREGFFPSVQNV